VREQSRRERFLDQVHARLEAHPRPKEPRRKTILSPRSAGNREMCTQLADFLTAGGL
jgi:hypothetical protein